MADLSTVTAPAIGSDKNTYTQKIDDLFQASRDHDHTGAKGAALGAGSVGPTQLQSDAVTTAKVLDQAITRAKLAAPNLVRAASVINGNTSSVSPVTIGGVGTSVTITSPSGRPVMVWLEPTSANAEIYNLANSAQSAYTNASVTVQFEASQDTITTKRTNTLGGGMSFHPAAGPWDARVVMPLGACQAIFYPPAGVAVTYTPKFAGYSYDSFQVNVVDCRLVAFEM